MPDGPMKRLNWTRRPRKVVLVAFQRGWRGVTGWARRLQGAVAFAVRLVDRWLNESVRRVFRFLENRLGPITVVVIAVVVAISIVFWDWLSFGESGSTTIRNVGLVLAALVALPLAVWRSKVAERQASAAQRQADTAQQNLLNERYQRGAEMLGSDVLAVRLGGIYALQRLAQEHPKQYHIQIMRLFCSFVRNPTVDGNRETGLANHETGEFAETQEDDGGVRPRQDVEAVMEAIAARSKIGIELERAPEFQLDLRDAKLRGLNLMNFREVNLSWTNLSFADMSRVNMRPLTDMSWIHAVSVNLSGACLADVNLSVTQFIGADLSGTLLHGANLSGAVFSDRNKDTPCRLTQAQLDSARAAPNQPPHLDGVLDAKTGKQLVWRGKPLDD